MSTMTVDSYQEFLAHKNRAVPNSGISIDDGAVHSMLFPFQRRIVKWALAKGRCAVFADTGLGKTFIQIEWARLLGMPTLIIAPLSVARQTIREAAKLGVVVHYARTQADAAPSGISITNYEMAEHFDMAQFGAVVLDESSILKALGGKTRRKLIQLCAGVQYRLACTATPAPNDVTELGNHAEFLGVCSHAEMLAMFFINANKEHTFFIDGQAFRKKGTNKGGTEWRLKHHAEEAFYRWLSSWAITMTKPSDLGFDDDGFILPELTIVPHSVAVEYQPEGQLFFTHMKGITDRVGIRRKTVDERLQKLAELIDGSEGQWIVWCGLDAESHAVAATIPDCVEVCGADDPDAKADAFERFQAGGYKVLSTKGRIAGFGLNMQNAHHMAFMGLSDSWETWYQCIRREWRFGQTHPVTVHVILSDLEQEILANIARKDAQAKRLRAGLINVIRSYEMTELGLQSNGKEEYMEAKQQGRMWTAMLGDSCERLKELVDNSVDLSVYSPPFADLFTYTNSTRDLGNSKGGDEFFTHYRYIIRECLRVTRPGRLTCVHTSDIPAMAQRDGYIGIKDFPGDVIRAYQAEGWVFTGRAFVQKNPQAQAIRTKSKALLFVQLRKDSADSRPALIDQILIFRKPGDNTVPVRPVENGEIDNETWIEWAHGIWLGIQETDTLQYSVARASDDEKHICPLQLGVIERCIKLYSNPGETVLTPFMGIGSEAYMAVRLGRRAVGIELKQSYFETAVNNLRIAEQQSDRKTIFDFATEQAAG